LGAKKQYAGADFYERKLKLVVEKFGATNLEYNWDRFGGWAQFRYRGELYRFEHSIESAKAKGINLIYGTDAFAQVVLAIEDLWRLQSRGIYDLTRWIAGMRFLPPPTEILPCFKNLGFTEQPKTRAEVQERYRTLSKQLHPDNPQTGDAVAFEAVKKAAEQALSFYKDGE
jgi:hypothetical protein